MGARNTEMGENFTGVKNQKVTRLAAALAAVVVVASAADMALVQPRELQAQLAGQGTHPVIFMVGPNVLYRSKHIPGAIYAGQGAMETGLAVLKTEAGKLPRDREVVLYCGCCPWDHCPFIRPAMNLLKQMGFTRAKALYLDTGFQGDWLDKGYAAEARR
jgi:thiosulfate/3-mercaptopyruvate sulfurtransferase